MSQKESEGLKLVKEAYATHLDGLDHYQARPELDIKRHAFVKAIIGNSSITTSDLANFISDNAFSWESDKKTAIDQWVRDAE